MKNRRLHKKTKLTPAQKEAIYALPLCKQFRIVHIDPCSGLAVFQHVLVDTEAHDYPQVLAVAKAYARETNCAINPIVNKGAPEGRTKIYPNLNCNGNPDLTTKKYGYVDVKSPVNRNNIVRNANDACKQGAIVVITDLMLEQESITEDEIEKFTNRIYSNQNINHFGEHNYTPKEVHWFIDGRLYKCNKPEKN